MEIIRYDLRSAYEAGIKMHPQKDVERLGMKVLHYEGVPIGDCAIINVESLIKELPNYIDIITETYIS